MHSLPSVVYTASQVKSPYSPDIDVETFRFGSSCPTFIVKLEGAGNSPKLLLDAFIFQSPAKFGL